MRLQEKLVLTLTLTQPLPKPNPGENAPITRANAVAGHSRVTNDTKQEPEKGSSSWVIAKTAKQGRGKGGMKRGKKQQQQD